MRVFVTGGAGYIGSVCVEELLRAGHRVFVYDNLSEGHRKAVPKKAEFLEAELADKRALRRALSDFKTDAVLHFAASALVGESMANPAKYFENNVGGGLALVEAAVSAGVRRLVFSSTCATYGLPERVPIPEDHPQRPINPYGQSKLMFEQILEWYGRLKGLVHVSLRYFNAAGASEEHGEDHRIETHLIPNVLKVALDQAPHVEVFGNDYATPDGTCIRDYIHVLDLADAHIRALSLERPEQINLGTGNGTSVQQVIDAARR
ncbi:MAG: UDP-glucose 4-epimerase GalE, partial [Verrucomicrobiae bacterium]|nr:UDP-glucose 4-epimerase GalE [Verrucomicrobiae bacterium]